MMEKTRSMPETDDCLISESSAESAREELEAELDRLHRKGRRNMFAVGLLSVLMIAGGVVMYMTRQADSATFPGTGYAYSGPAVDYTGYTGTGGLSGGAGTDPVGGGCGSGGGCCGGGAALGNVSPADLEKKAAEQYAKETGKTGFTAKANDYGCHIQIDLYDAKGKIVRSYGYRGGPLYVIQ